MGRELALSGMMEWHLVKPVRFQFNKRSPTVIQAKLNFCAPVEKASGLQSN
ncbi:MAG TPA: hypothetical protein V6D26_08385 [Stenomitos sp.]